MEPDIASYEIWRQASPGEPDWHVVATVTTNSYTDNQYIWTSPYGDFYVSYKIRAKDIADLYSGYSNTASTGAEVYGEAPKHPTDQIKRPEDYSLAQNHPNPFNPETEISFALPEHSSVKITVLDLLGRQIMTLVERNYSAGFQKVIWDGTDASGNKVGTGVYFYRIVATGESGKQFTKVMKMLVTK